MFFVLMKINSLWWIRFLTFRILLFSYWFCKFYDLHTILYLQINRTFRIFVQDVNESPTSIHIIDKNASITPFVKDQPVVHENQPTDTVIGTIQAIDQDTVTDLIFKLIDNANGAFVLDGKVTCQNVSDANGTLFIFHYHLKKYKNKGSLKNNHIT